MKNICLVFKRFPECIPSTTLLNAIDSYPQSTSETSKLSMQLIVGRQSRRCHPTIYYLVYMGDTNFADTRCESRRHLRKFASWWEFQVSTPSLICLAVVETRSTVRTAGARTGRLYHGSRYGRARALVTASRPALASILIGDATDPVCESVFRSRGHAVDFKPGLSKV